MKIEVFTDTDSSMCCYRKQRRRQQPSTRPSPAPTDTSLGFDGALWARSGYRHPRTTTMQQDGGAT